MYANEQLQYYAEVGQNGEWSAGVILPSRSISDPLLILDYHITGIPSPGEDATQIQTIITVDETKPVVQFSTAPLSLTMKI